MSRPIASSSAQDPQRETTSGLCFGRGKNHPFFSVCFVWVVKDPNLKQKANKNTQQKKTTGEDKDQLKPTKNIPGTYEFFLKKKVRLLLFIIQKPQQK